MLSTKLLKGILISLPLMTGMSVANAATNVAVISDPQEITDFMSGYDLAKVEFILDINDTLTADLFTYGVPGDTDGDGNADTSSNPLIIDGAGVGSYERLVIGMVCGGGTSCVPNLSISYTNNTLTVNPPLAVPYISFNVLEDRYQLVISNLSALKQAVLGYTPAATDFSSVNIAMVYNDGQPEDFFPDRDPTTGALTCEQISLEPPVVVAPGTGTIGYWKNHPTDWPANCELYLPGSENDANVFAMNVLEAPVKGDKTVALAKQLVAAKLNACAGNDSSCVDQTIIDSIAWLQGNPVFSGQKQWLGADDHQLMLDDYNNGKLCAAHRE